MLKQTLKQIVPQNAENTHHHVVTIKAGYKRGLVIGFLVGFFVGGLMVTFAKNDPKPRSPWDHLQPQSQRK